MSNWITDFFKNRGIKKEADLTDKRTEYDRKMQSSSWIKEAMDIDEGAPADPRYAAAAAILEDEYGVEANDVDLHEWLRHDTSSTPEEIADQIAEKYELDDKSQPFLTHNSKLKKAAAYEMGDDMKETIKKDYELRVKGLSDMNLAEMLTEMALKFEGLPERWSVEIEKQKKYVSGHREEAEKKLLKLLGTPTVLDWKEAFKKFEEEDGTKEPKGLYEPEFTPGKQNWDKKEDFEAPTDKEKTKAMEEVGTGHEEAKKAIGDEKLLEEQRKEASVQDDEIVAQASKADTIKKIAEVDSIWKVTKDEKGQEFIARVEPVTNTKESNEEEDANKINSSELH